MSNDVDYTFVVGNPPPQNEFAANMEATVEHAGVPCRVARYKKRSTADSTASELRRGRRYPERAEGTWTFKVLPDADKPGWFGVWATFVPPPDEP
jgi:hypothetical protein